MKMSSISKGKLEADPNETIFSLLNKINKKDLVIQNGSSIKLKYKAINAAGVEKERKDFYLSLSSYKVNNYKWLSQGYENSLST